MFRKHLLDAALDLLAVDGAMALFKAVAGFKNGDPERGGELRQLVGGEDAAGARADDDEPVALVDAQNMADLGAQLRHVVAVALLAELAEAAQILPYLRGGDVHLRPQGVRADAYHTLVIQVIQVAVVAGQPVDHSIGDFLFFHIETLFGLEYGAKHRNLVAILQQVRRVVNFFNNLSAKNFLENGFTSAGRTAIIPRVE